MLGCLISLLARLMFYETREVFFTRCICNLIITYFFYNWNGRKFASETNFQNNILEQNVSEFPTYHQ